MNKIQFNNLYNEGGSALIYILIAIALLAALTFTFMEPSSQQTSSQNSFKTVSSLQGQADMIRSAIQECVLSYPRGDRCLKSDESYCDSNAQSENGFTDYDNYPIDPDHDYYAGATPGRAGNSYVRNMRCPGNNPSDNSDTHDNHARIFGGSTGKFLPPPPDLFEEWQMYNATDGVFFWTSTDKTDAFLLTALNKLDKAFSDDEADVVDASSGAVDLDVAGSISCASGSYCFRVWMIDGR